jgi:TldD protein
MVSIENFLKSLESTKYSEVRYHKNSSMRISMINGSISSIEKSVKEGYGIRIYKDNLLYFYSIKDLNNFDLKPISFRSWEEGFLESSPIKLRYEAKEEIKFNNISLEEKIKFLKEISNNIKNLKLEGKLESFSISYIELEEVKEFYNSEGSVIYSRVPRLWIYFTIVLRNGDRSASLWSDELGASGGYELLKKWDLSEFILNKVKNLDLILDKGKSPPSDKLDVILSSQIAGIIAHESIGHPFEADRVLGRESAQAGRSYLNYIKEKKLGSEIVNVVDDPTLYGSMGYYLVDDEGVRARRRYLLRNCEVSELLHSRFTAYKFRTENNGSVRAMDYESEPIIRMSNTFFLPSNIKFEELLEDIKHGVYIESFMEWNIDDIRWGQRYVGLEAYRIENGEIKEPIIYPILEATTNEILKSIDAVDNNLRFYAGLCGKGEPSQGVPVWMGGPNLRLRNIRVKRIGETY